MEKWVKRKQVKLDTRAGRMLSKIAAIRCFSPPERTSIQSATASHPPSRVSKYPKRTRSRCSARVSSVIPRLAISSRHKHKNLLKNQGIQNLKHLMAGLIVLKFFIMLYVAMLLEKKLFHHAILTKTMSLKVKKCIVGKFYKERITVFVCGKMKGIMANHAKLICKQTI
ncbi:hypothetical protein J437_LFUL005296 [Ladona fulva]|uniref:Uncharacterized protein n=1 Tax=Ladona fulva TaxID=123851 RepID=A0A8K0K1N9_LADFU|nr:hypothetical protein J437_LFUL005296 [Ladona fulva]